MKRFDSAWAKVWALVGGLVVMIGAFWVVTTAADVVPDEEIVATLLQAQGSGAWNIDEALNDFGYPVDRYTECVAFTQGLGSAPGVSSRLGQSMADLHLAPDGCVGVGEALQKLSTGQQVEGTPYYRYWHGYAPLTRSLLAWTDLQTLRTTVTLLLVAGFASFIVSLARTAGLMAGIAFAAPLLLTTDLLSLPASSTQSLTWSAIFGSAAIGMLATSRWGRWGALSVGLYAGALFAFIDLLTNPPAAVMVLLAAVLTVLCVGQERLAGSVVTTAWVGVAWSVGYVVTWAAKWFISALAFGFPAVESSIRDMIAFRISGSYGSVEHTLGAATRANWQQWLDTNSLVRPFLLLTLLAAVLVVVRGARRVPQWTAWLGLYLLVATIPILWYELLSNHSQIHARFTYRSLAVSLAVVLLGAVVVSVSGARRRAGFDVRRSREGEASEARPEAHASR